MEISTSSCVKALNPPSFTSLDTMLTIPTGPDASSSPFPVVTRSFSAPRIAPDAFTHSSQLCRNPSRKDTACFSVR